MNSTDEPGESEIMRSSHGRIVHSSARDLPYKAVLVRHDGSEAERSFATMREAEAFIKRSTPRPRGRSTSWDRRRS